MRIRLEHTDTTSHGTGVTRAVEVESHGMGISRLREFAIESLRLIGAHVPDDPRDEPAEQNEPYDPQPEESSGLLLPPVLGPSGSAETSPPVVESVLTHREGPGDEE